MSVATPARPARRGRLDSPRRGPAGALSPRILSFTARLRSDSWPVLSCLERLYPVAGSDDPSGQPATTFDVETVRGRTGRVGYRVRRNGRPVARFDSESEVVGQLECLINSAAISALGEHVLLHAGAVETPAGGLLFPGPSGLGKSTLVAALCLAGHAYLSDDVAVVEARSAGLLPFSKAICLKEGGRRILAAGPGWSESLPSAIRPDGETVHYLVPPRLGAPERPVPVRHVVLLDRRADASVALTPVGRGAALAELARHSLNLPRHGSSGLEALALLVEGAQCWRLSYRDLAQATAALVETVSGAQR